MQEITIESLKSLILEGLKEIEILFTPPLSIWVTRGHELTTIKGISVDGNERLWYKDIRGNWNEINDQLMYKKFYLQSINEKLTQALSSKKVGNG